VHTDTVVVGGGFAGLCAAWVLGTRGCDVVVVERSPACRPCFKAEKLEPYQSRLLREFGLLQERRPASEPIIEIGERRGAHCRSLAVGEQYGMRYHDTVNRMRRVVSERVEVRDGLVEAIENGPDRQLVRLRDGSTLRARLVILAAGGTGSLVRDLGMRRKEETRLRTLSLGFDLRRADGGDFPFRGFNYVPGHAERHRVNLLTLFRIDGAMRANLFTGWSPRDARVREFLEAPLRSLGSICPGLDRDTGRMELDGRVQAVPTIYHRLEAVIQPGVAVIGEEFQSVSPATGTGLDKVLTDVAVLREHVPEWLATPGMGVEKIARFYQDPLKRRIDERSRAEWVHSHNRTFRPRTARLRRLSWRVGNVLTGRLPA
jgi:2-polyprenyl-6-methoxyphenol hydroxylase-like FAD-dependent oxidoreductase